MLPREWKVASGNAIVDIGRMVCQDRGSGQGILGIHECETCRGMRKPCQNPLSRVVVSRGV